MFSVKSELKWFGLTTSVCPRLCREKATFAREVLRNFSECFCFLFWHPVISALVSAPRMRSWEMGL